MRPNHNTPLVAVLIIAIQTLITNNLFCNHMHHSQILTKLCCLKHILERLAVLKALCLISLQQDAGGE